MAAGKRSDSSGRKNTGDFDGLAILNQLRGELLDKRAETLNRWLTIVALFLTFFGIIVTLASFLGFQRFLAIETEVRGLLDQVNNLRGEMTFHGERTATLERKLEDLEKEEGDFETASGGGPESKPSGVSGAGVPPLSILENQPLWIHSGFLSSGESTTLDLDLPRAGEYRFVGECDAACGDLDMLLYRRGGPDRIGPRQRLSRDALSDAIPIVGLETAGPDNVSIEVIMVRCTEGECSWELRSYLR